MNTLLVMLPLRLSGVIKDNAYMTSQQYGLFNAQTGQFITSFNKTMKFVVPEQEICDNLTDKISGLLDQIYEGAN